MRRLYRIAQLLMLTLAFLCPWAGAQDADSEAEARELARQTLNGRTAIIRLYTDWKANPKAYTTLSVPLEGLDVGFDAVRQAASRDVPADAVVVVVPSDQQDPAVADVMGGCLFGEPYQPGGRLSLRPGTIPPVQLSPCLFKDALDQPIPNAEVEILLSDNAIHYSARTRLWIANARFDENGRMPSLKASASSRVHAFLFVVIHPDCGPVTAMSHYSSWNPGEDHRLSVPALPKDKWCVFVDALGHPMAGATVEVVTGLAWQQSAKYRLSPIRLDEAGRLRPPQVNPTLEHCCFLVQDPNCGMAIVEPWINVVIQKNQPLSLCPVPLVAAGTRADERSIWGTAVDPNGVPVPGVVLQCMRVNVPGGGFLDAWWPWQVGWGKQAKVLTDAEGRFAMHLPLANSDGMIGRPVPPGATYEVMIDPTSAAGFQPHHGRLAAGQEHTITLEPKPSSPKSPSDVMVFCDERGPVADIEKLRLVVVSIRNPRSGGGFITRTLGPGSWMEQGELSPGVYAATAEWDGIRYTFGPVEVTAETPEPLIFTPTQIKPARQICYGRVVHGITGEPIAGALVMRRPEPGMIDEADEDLFMQIFYLGPELDPDGELIKLLESYPEVGVTRTDASGRFETIASTDSPMRPFSRLIAIRKDFLGAEQCLVIPLPGLDENGGVRFQEFEPDATGKVPLPDMKLFPAGTVVVEPSIPEQAGPRREKDVRFHFRTAPGDPTPWLKDLWAMPVSSQGGSVFRRNKLPINQSQSVYVPADVTLTLTIQRRDEQSAPVVIENIHLRKGEVLDLGRVEFPRGMQIVVRVIDSAGEPLEGITVKCLPEGGVYLGSGSVTDSRGIAQVYVPLHSRGRLVVEYLGKEMMAMVREGTPYEVGGQEDAGREFVLQLSDEFLEQLFQSR